MTTQRRTARPNRSEDGAGLVEYLLLLSLIFVVCLVSLSYFGTSLDSRFSSVGSSIGATSPP